jgi:hypothetical protein
VNWPISTAQQYAGTHEEEMAAAGIMVLQAEYGDRDFMWLPYAELRDMKKPVELIVLNTEEHMITNPGVRMASQGGSVDWFRFWLQGYEDPDPAKASS